MEAFLRPRLSAWLPDETLASHGVDSLDEVQLRNEFERAFPGGPRAPLQVFARPDQSLRQLVGALAALLLLRK